MWEPLLSTGDVPVQSGRSKNVARSHSLALATALLNPPGCRLRENSQMDRFDDGWILSRTLREEDFTEYGKWSMVLRRKSFSKEILLNRLFFWNESTYWLARKEQWSVNRWTSAPSPFVLNIVYYVHWFGWCSHYQHKYDHMWLQIWIARWPILSSLSSSLKPGIRVWGYGPHLFNKEDIDIERILCETRYSE